MSVLRRYVPTGRGGPFAFTAVLGIALASGLVVGALEGAIDKWFSLFLVFPALIGLAAGGGAAWMIGRQRLRAPLLAMLLGAAGGAAGYLAVHAVDYVRFRADVGELLRGERPGTDNSQIADAADAVDAVLVQETGEAGFRGFLEIAARQGVSLKHAGASDKGLAFTGIGAWLLWLCELLVSAGIAGAIARGRAKAPFCESCDTWYGPERELAAGGGGAKATHQAMLSALASGDLAGAAGALAPPPSAKASFVLTASTCPRCGVDAHCTLKRVVYKKKGPQVSALASWLMTRDEAARFGDAVTQVRARPGAGVMSP
jgi:hypothetical protein